MNIRSISKISGLVAVFALLAFSMTPVTQADGISIIDQRCVDGDGVVEVSFPSDINSFKLSGPDTDEQNTNANFKTFSDLSDGSYTLTAYTASGGATATFTVDCDQGTPTPEPDPKVSIEDQRCENNDGVVEFSFENVSSFQLFGPNTDEQNTNANFKTFSDLSDGHYRLNVWSGENKTGEKKAISFDVSCDKDPEPTDCSTEDAFDHLKVAKFDKTPNDTNESITIKNTSNECAYSVNFTSYKLFKQPNTSGWLDTQKFFDNETKEIAPGQSKTLTINTPSCAYQVDAYTGPVIKNLTSSGHSNLLAYDVVINSNHPLCGEEKEGPKFNLEAKSCVDGDGTAEIKTTSGLDSYKLINTSTGKTVVNDTDGASIGAISFTDLPDGNYRFEGTLNGETKSLTFTIDCDEAGPELSGECVVSDSTVGLSDDVTFTANASGGESPYSYSWDLEGSDDDADTKSVTTEYNQTGTYDATVTISDNAGDQIIRTCSVTVKTNDDDDDDGGGGGGDRLDPRGKKKVRGDRDVNFGVQCLPDKAVYGVGEVVLFEATIDNDDIDLDDVDFDWSGASNINETNETATVQFTTGGVKEIRVRAEHDGDTETDTCYVQIGRGVSLDEVPYTGPGDMAKTLAFVTTILLLALGGGYAIIKRREEEGIPVGIPNKHN